VVSTVTVAPPTVINYPAADITQQVVRIGIPAGNCGENTRWKIYDIGAILAAAFTIGYAIRRRLIRS